MSSEDQGGAGRREVAYRLFAAEFEDADFSYSESDEERAPNYVVTPSGARVNRLFVVGVLTEVENASEDVLRARVVDPTGAFVVYAGQYQPDAQAFFERAEPPMFVAVTGKARTFQPDDSDVTYTSVRPENVNEVDAETRDRWTVGTARQTLDRVRTMAEALRMDERGDDLRTALESRGTDAGLAAGVPLAIDHYGTTAAYLDALRTTAVSAVEVVADERDEIEPHTAAPDARGDADLAALAGIDVTASVGGESDDLGGGVDDAATGTDDSVTDETASGTAPGGTSAGAGESADETATDDESADTATAETTGESGGDAGADADSGETTVEASGAVDETTEPATTEASESATAEGPTVETVEATVASDTTSGSTSADAESSVTNDSGADSGADDLDDFDPGEFELDEEEREEIESEYGTDFQSGTEVDQPGEAGIETPDPEEVDETTAETAETAASADSTGDSEPTEESVDTSVVDEPAETDGSTEAEPADESSATEPAEDVDLEDAVMDAMRDNDDDGGAHADEIVDAVTARIDADPDAVREAIQDALMDGRCYEPDDDVYKPI